MQEISNMGAGNGGHDKDCPRWGLLKDPARRGHLPKILQGILDSLFDYYSDPEALPALAQLNANSTRQDGKKRQNRSEARETECLVMAALIHHLDLTTLRVGKPIQGTSECLYYSTKELAETAGLLHPTTGKPLRKFTRAFVRLQQVGFVNTQIVAKSNSAGEIRRRNSAKVVTDVMLLSLLGGDSDAKKFLKAERDKHSRVTRRRLIKTPEQLKAQERKNFHQEVSQKAQEKRVDRELAKVEQMAAAAAMLSPAGKEAAYRKARQAHQNQLLNSGLGFAEIHAQMKAFPELERWNP